MSAKYWGIITYLELLIMVLLIQGIFSCPCCQSALLTCCPTGYPKLFLQRFFFNQFMPRLTCHMEMVCPSCKTLRLSLLNFEYPVTPFLYPVELPALDCVFSSLLSASSTVVMKVHYDT